MTPGQALELHHEALKFMRQRGAINYVERFRLALAQKSGGVDRFGDTTSREVVEREGYYLSIAETFLVTSEMMTLARHAGQSMPWEPLQESDLPCAHGFCVQLDPADGLVIRRWSAIDNKSNRGLYTAVYHQPDAHVPMVVATGFYPFDEPVPKAVSVGVPENLAPQSDVAFQTQRALFALMRQSLAGIMQERPERAFRRRLAKDNSPVAGNAVKVVVLRRLTTKHDAGEPSNVEWSHRWIVSGHWRNQWCPKAGMHRQTWISPYAKGPEDKPLVLKKTVSVLAR